jgi:hypothetical protein
LDRYVVGRVLLLPFRFFGVGSAQHVLFVVVIGAIVAFGRWGRSWLIGFVEFLGNGLGRINGLGQAD